MLLGGVVGIKRGRFGKETGYEVGRNNLIWLDIRLSPLGNR